MDNLPANPPAALLASPLAWPLEAARQWSLWLGLAPQNLFQPINAGVTLGGVINITEHNSSAPDTEREVLDHHSYGRQLGRIMDALSVVLDKGLPDKKNLSADEFRRVERFFELARNIDEIKSREALKRVRRIAGDLAFLKERYPAEYAQAQAALTRIVAG